MATAQPSSNDPEISPGDAGNIALRQLWKYEFPKAPVLQRARIRTTALIQGRITQAAAAAAPTFPYCRWVDCNVYHPYDFDWEAGKEGKILIAGIRLTAGISYVDPDAWTFAQAAHAAGVYIWPYHAFNCAYGGEAQATFFLDQLQPYLDLTGGIIGPATLDIETKNGVTALATRQSRINTCADYINAEHGEPCGYSSPYLWQDVAGNMTWKYLGWEAHYTSADYPAQIIGWDPEKLKAHQYGIFGTHWWVEPVPGLIVPGDIIDCNRFFGSEEDLNNFMGNIPQNYVELNSSRTFYNDETTASPVVMTRAAGFKIKYEFKETKDNGKTWYRCSDSAAPSQALWFIGAEGPISYVTEYQK